MSFTQLSVNSYWQQFLGVHLLSIMKMSIRPVYTDFTSNFTSDITSSFTPSSTNFLYLMRTFKATLNFKTNGLKYQFILIAKIFLLLCVTCNLTLAQEPSTTNGQQVTPLVSSFGTGFSVANGYFITAQHVIQDCDLVLIGPVQANKWIKATVIKTNLASDLALLSADIKSTPLSIAPYEAIPIGLEVFSIGFPQPKTQGFGKKITQGIINGNRTDKAKVINNEYFQYSAETQVGNSGGPLLGPDAQVIGVTLSKLNALSAAEKTNDLAINVSYGLKSSKLIEFLQDTPAQPTVRKLELQGNLRAYQIFEKTESSVFAVLARKSKPN